MQRAAISHDYGSALYQYCLQKIIMHEKLRGRRPPCDPRGLGPESRIWVSPQRSQWGLRVGAIQRLLFVIFLSEFFLEFWAWIVKWDEISTWFASLLYMHFVVICADICICGHLWWLTLSASSTAGKGLCSSWKAREQTISRPLNLAHNLVHA